MSAFHFLVVKIVKIVITCLDHIHLHRKLYYPSITISWHSTLTNHKQIAAVFIDIKKAVPHSHLIKALHSIGIQGSQESLLSWLKDYLTSRHQRVVLDGHLTSCHNVFINPLSELTLSPNTQLTLCGC